MEECKQPLYLLVSDYFRIILLAAADYKFKF